MKRRKAKKLCKCGTLLTIEGTSCVFMSLGLVGKNTIDSFNGVDICKGELISRCDGKARVATRKECAMYWTVMRHHIAVMKRNGVKRTDFCD